MLWYLLFYPSMALKPIVDLLKIIVNKLAKQLSPGTRNRGKKLTEHCGTLIAFCLVVN